jgi:hypothetical protein
MSQTNNQYSPHILSQRNLPVVLFWGALWGLSEATLGHLLHIVRIPGLAGFVMFPVGIFFMLKAYHDSSHLRMILLTASVAATIKLSDLLIPGALVLDVLRPALAILAESLVVIGLAAIVDSKIFQRHLIHQKLF